MTPPIRNISRASYAPLADREIVKQAVAQKRVENRQAAATTGAQERRRPILGKDAQDTQELRENAALMIIKAELKAKKYIKSMESERRKLRANNGRNDTAGYVDIEKEGRRTMIKEGIITSNKCFQREKEMSHAAAMIMCRSSDLI